MHTLQERKYFVIGQLMAMGLCHGASRFPFICPHIYNCIAKPSVTDIVITKDDIPDIDVRELVEMVCIL